MKNFKDISKVYFLWVLVLYSVGSLADDSPVVELFSVTTINNQNASVAAQEPDQYNVAIQTTRSNYDLTLKQKVRAFLPFKGNVLGHVVSKFDSKKTSSVQPNTHNYFNDKATVISLDGRAGAIELIEDELDNRIKSIRAFDASSLTYYEAKLDINGKGTFKKLDIQKIQCVDYTIEQHQSDIRAEQQISEIVPDNLTLDYIKSLQSNPNAEHVIFINSYGGVLTETAWNTNYTSNQPIYYDAYDTDGNTASFTQDELKDIWFGWKTTAEDYAPFDVNITADINVYRSTPVAKRSQIISTTYDTRNSFYTDTNAAGVAFLNVYNSNSDYLKTAWTFSQTGSYIGNVHSHESGHQLGLSHDGFYQDEYYAGHNSWAPIMGSSLRRFVQWSKGEYDGATNTEDDLQIIAAELGVVADKEGYNFTTATIISEDVEGEYGLLIPDGLQNDSDFYTFTVGQERFVDIEVFNDLIYQGQQYGSNLTLSLKVFDAEKELIYQDTELHNNTNYFYGVISSLPLEAGQYYLQISSKSIDPNPTRGFSNYANGGAYRISIKDVDTSDYMVFRQEFKNLSNTKDSMHRQSFYIPEDIPFLWFSTYWTDYNLVDYTNITNVDLYLGFNKEPDIASTPAMWDCASTEYNHQEYCNLESTGGVYNVLLHGVTDYSNITLEMAYYAQALGDIDSDGIPNIYEDRYHKTSLLSADTDGDGIKDSTEIKNGSDPLNAVEDTDDDGFTNVQELKAGSDPYDKAETPLNIPANTLPWLKVLYSDK